MKRARILFIFASLIVTASHAQQKKNITAVQAFKYGEPRLYKYPPVFEWLDDTHYSFERHDGNAEENKAGIFDATTGKGREASTTELEKFSGDVHPQLINKNNDLYLTDDDIEVRLTNDAAEEKNATFSPDYKWVAYTKNNNLYSVEVATKKETQLTSDGSETILNGYLSWVYMEEILGRPTHYKAFWWSPDSKMLCFYRTDDSPVPVFPIYNAEGLRGSLINTRYPQPGDDDPMVKVGLVAPQGGNINWASFDPTLDQYFGTPQWQHDSKSIFLTWCNRDQNNLKVYQVNVPDGKIKEVYDEKQSTWVSIDETTVVTLLEDQSGFIIKSDKSGWMNLSLYDMNGKLKNEITTGKGDVSEILFIDEKKRLLFFTASKQSPMRDDLYSVQLDGKNLKRLSFGDYDHSIEPSENASYFKSTYSNHSDAGGIAIIDRNSKYKMIYDSKNTALDGYNIPKTEIFTVKSDDGLFDLPVKVIYPADFNPSKKYPLLINIYGGPGAKNINDNYVMSPQSIWWAQEGIVQVTMDHRASGQFGKKGMEYMYRDLGHWEITDYSTVIRSLESKGWVNEKKVCITGFSYGGYVTCMALTKGADVFTHGMAGGSVVDWALYDNIYTERYMDKPADNPEGYKSGSVLTYADQYKGKLLLVHGTTDDNVHMQNTLQLVKSFEDKKKDFEMMVYPTGKHGWGGNQGIHYQNLSTEFIYKYILEKPVPDGAMR